MFLKFGFFGSRYKGGPGRAGPGGGDITDITVSGNELVVTHSDGSKRALELPNAAPVKTPLTAAMISKALDNGTATGSGSLKGLADGWWHIPASNPNLSGRPKNAQGDLSYFQQTITPSAGKKYGVGLAFGKDTSLKDSVWAQYKEAGSWTPWVQENGEANVDLSVINSEIDELKRGNQAVLDELAKIQTAAGKLFAPTKALFDIEANKLIDAKIAGVDADVERDLTAKGWGPLPKAKFVTGISLSDTNDLTITYSDGSTSTVVLEKAQGDAPAIQALKGELTTLEAEMKKNGVDVDALKAQLGSINQKLIKVKSIYSYTGSGLPKYPQAFRSAYFVNLFGQASATVEVALPSPKAALLDGTLYMISNSDTDSVLRVSPGVAGNKVNKAAYLDVPSESFALLGKYGANWKILSSGYIEKSKASLLKTIQDSLKSELPGEIQKGVESSLTDNDYINKLAAALNKSGLIQAGMTFVNPDGSEEQADKLKLVAMEVQDPHDGTAKKLLLLDHHSDKPQPSPTSAYAFFSPLSQLSSTAPDFDTLQVYRDGKVTLHKDTTDPQYAYIILPPGEGDDVQRVGEVGGLPAYWSKESKAYSIRGTTRTYTIFRSPYRFKETDLTFVLYP